MSTTTHYGFIPAAGTNFTTGEEPEIAKRLDKLAQELHQNIYGISGYRTPAQSTAVGGFANDPHTQAQAADIGLGGQLRASAGVITNKQLESVGLWRPFDLTGSNPTEVNHVQLLPSAGGPKVAGVKAPASGGGGGGGVLGGLEAGIQNSPLGGAFDIGKLATEGAEAVGVPTPASISGDIASKLIGLFGEWFGAAFARAALYVLLVGGGVALVVAGVSRAAGLHPVEGARKTAKVASRVGEVAAA